MKSYFGHFELPALALSTVCAPSLTAQVIPKTILPRLDVTLRPNVAGDAIDIAVRIETPGLPAGGALATLPRTVVSMPGIVLSLKDIDARDADGPLALTEHDLPADGQGQAREFQVARAAHGVITLRYQARSRIVDRATRVGPLFDLRAQPGGINGAGVTFLMLPTGDKLYRSHIHWDMTAMPGAAGVTTYGEGDVVRDASADELRYAYYYVGRLDARKEGPFSLYWTTRPPFDAARLGQSIGAFFDTVTAFASAPRDPYRVFIRENPFPGSGGTALGQSFLLGYDAKNPLPFDRLQTLVAHEMTHSWFKIEGSHAETAWYSEGTAEYYSMLLLLRAHRITVADFANMLNERALSYWGNPLSSLDNEAVAKRFWSDNAAQRIPYGRGLLYFVNTNARIRQKSGGTRSIDDPIQAFIGLEHAGQKPGVKVWLSLIRAEIGDAADADFKAMTAGKPITPIEGAFGPCLRLVPGVVRPFDLGFDQVSLDHGQLGGVRADGPAARAGLRNGDRVVETSSVFRAVSDVTGHMQIKVERDGRATAIDYLPRGAINIPVRRWQHDRSVPDSYCRF